VMGGAHASECAADIMRDYNTIDYIVIGEAEESFLMLLKHIESGENDLIMPFKLSEEMGIKAREKAVQEFDIRKYANDFDTIFKMVLRKV